MRNQYVTATKIILPTLLKPKILAISRGFVRLIGRELADRRRSRLLRGELTPFSECGSTVLLEVLTAF